MLSSHVRTWLKPIKLQSFFQRDILPWQKFFTRFTWLKTELHETQALPSWRSLTTVAQVNEFIFNESSLLMYRLFPTSFKLLVVYVRSFLFEFRCYAVIDDNFVRIDKVMLRRLKSRPRRQEKVRHWQVMVYVTSWSRHTCSKTS